jgi:hypothetical protein
MPEINCQDLVVMSLLATQSVQNVYILLGIRYYDVKADSANFNRSISGFFNSSSCLR